MKNFKQEWDKKEFAHVEKMIKKYLKSRHFEHSGDYNPNLFDALGLAYTSSSSYAGLWVCNLELYLDVDHKFHLIGFALSQNGFVYAIYWDENENELIININ